MRSETHGTLMLKQQEIGMLQQELNSTKQQLATMDAVIGQHLEVLGHSPAADCIPSSPSEQIQLLVELASRNLENERERSLQLLSELQATKAQCEQLQQSTSMIARAHSDELRAMKTQLSTTTTELSQVKNEKTLLKNQLAQLEDMLHA